MAKLHEEIIIVKVSKLLKDSDVVAPIMSEDTLSSLEAVIQELAGAGALVEIASE